MRLAGFYPGLSVNSRPFLVSEGGYPPLGLPPPVQQFIVAMWCVAT